MVSIATNDDLAGLAIAASEEGKGDKQLDKSTAGDDVNNIENGEKSVNIDLDIDDKNKEIEGNYGANWKKLLHTFKIPQTRLTSYAVQYRRYVHCLITIMPCGCRMSTSLQMLGH